MQPLIANDIEFSHVSPIFDIDADIIIIIIKIGFVDIITV